MASVEGLRVNLGTARAMLDRGDVPEAYRLLGGVVFDEPCEPAIIAGEASSLIRAGLIAEAIDRIDGYLLPNFQGRRAYAAAGVPSLLARMEPNP